VHRTREKREKVRSHRKGSRTDGEFTQYRQPLRLLASYENRRPNRNPCGKNPGVRGVRVSAGGAIEHELLRALHESEKEARKD